MGRESMVTMRAPNSTPMVRSWTGWNLLSVNWRSRHDFPTPAPHRRKTQTWREIRRPNCEKKRKEGTEEPNLCRRWWCTWRGSRTTWLNLWNDVV